MNRAKLIEQVANYIQSAPDGRYLISKVQNLHVPVKLNVLKWFDIHMCPLYDFIDYFLQCLEEVEDSHIIECGPDYVARSLMRFWFFILYMDQVVTEVFDINNLILGGFKFKVSSDPLNYDKRFYFVLSGKASEVCFKLHLENIDTHGEDDIIEINLYFHLDGFVFCKHTLNEHDDLFEFPVSVKATTTAKNHAPWPRKGEDFSSNNLTKNDIISYINNLF